MSALRLSNWSGDRRHEGLIERPERPGRAEYADGDRQQRAGGGRHVEARAQRGQRTRRPPTRLGRGDQQREAGQQEGGHHGIHQHAGVRNVLDDRARGERAEGQADHRCLRGDRGRDPRGLARGGVDDVGRQGARGQPRAESHEGAPGQQDGQAGDVEEDDARGEHRQERGEGDRAAADLVGEAPEAEQREDRPGEVGDDAQRQVRGRQPILRAPPAGNRAGPMSGGVRPAPGSSASRPSGTRATAV